MGGVAKAPKRGHVLPHGEGSFYWAPARGLWVGKLEAGTGPDGKRRRIEVTARDEDKAWDKLTVRRKKLLTEGAESALQRTITLKAWMPTWLEQMAAELRPRSQRAIESYSRKWIVPTLGQRKLEVMTAADARKLVKATLDSGLSSTTAGKILETLQSALRAARAEGYAVPEPVLLVRKPAASAKRRSAIPVADALRLVEHIASRPDAARWIAALLQGMRQGECLGLTWECVDMQRREIDVSWQLQPLPYLDRSLGTFRIPHGYEVRPLWKAYHLVRPKTQSGQRIIPMVPWLHDSLEQWYAAAPMSPHGLVWPGDNGRPGRSEVDRATWYALQSDAGVAKPDGSRYVLHEARHTTATLLLIAGVDPAVIQAIMGHSDIVTTRGYTHAPRAMLLEALEKAAAQLKLTT